MHFGSVRRGVAKGKPIVGALQCSYMIRRHALRNGSPASLIGSIVVQGVWCTAYIAAITAAAGLTPLLNKWPEISTILPFNSAGKNVCVIENCSRSSSN